LRIPGGERRTALAVIHTHAHGIPAADAPDEPDSYKEGYGPEEPRVVDLMEEQVVTGLKKD